MGLLENDMNDLNGYPFLVDEKPFCVWGYDMPQSNKGFIKEFSPKYFSVIAAQNIKLLATDFKHQAAVNLRLAYSHGIETLFSMIFAELQAAYCVPAWILKCGTQELRSLVGKVGGPTETIPNMFGLSSLTWRDISGIVHSEMLLQDRDKAEEVISVYADLWKGFGAHFTNELEQHEYNSIKHGLRISPGGFTLSIQKESSPGVTDPGAPIHTISGSDFGSSFYTAEKLDAGAPNFYLTSHSKNWDARRIAVGLELIAASLENVRASLLFQNGMAKNNGYRCPEKSQLDEFAKSSVGIMTVSSKPNIDPRWVKDVTKEDVLNAYKHSNLGKGVVEGGGSSL